MENCLYLTISSPKAAYYLIRTHQYLHFVPMNTDLTESKVRRLTHCNPESADKLLTTHAAFSIRTVNIRRMIVEETEGKNTLQLWVGSKIQKYRTDQLLPADFYREIFHSIPLFIQQTHPRYGPKQSTVFALTLALHITVLPALILWLIPSESNLIGAGLCVMCAIISVMLITIYPGHFTIKSIKPPYLGDGNCGHLLLPILLPVLGIIISIVKHYI